MVQLKYFGDSRDFFKYDLIRSILERSTLSRYVFISMLTAHRPDNEGRKKPQSPDGRSNDLLKFIDACDTKSLRHWESWLRPHVKSYETVEPVDETFFSDEARTTYWAAFQTLMARQNALIFVDPDTGLETGKPWYLKKMGREKYILNRELKYLIGRIDNSSVLMLYQQLPRNKHLHEKTVMKKLEQVRSTDSSILTCAYREDDLSFLFVSKNGNLHNEICDLLCRYHDGSDHKHKSMHGSLSPSSPAED